MPGNTHCPSKYKRQSNRTVFIIKETSNNKIQSSIYNFNTTHSQYIYIYCTNIFINM